MDRCPCCKARIGETGVCSRCGTDLSPAWAAEQAAKHQLTAAINLWQSRQPRQSLDAVQLSILLNSTPLALALRDFFITRQCRDVLELLARQQIPAARQQLYQLRAALPHSELLRQITAFTDYLACKNPLHPI